MNVLAHVVAIHFRGKGVIKWRLNGQQRLLQQYMYIIMLLLNYRNTRY